MIIFHENIRLFLNYWEKSIISDTMPVLNWKNLPDTLMVRLEDSFRKKLFLDLYRKTKNFDERTKVLGCCKSSIAYYRRGDSFIPATVFRNLLKFSDLKSNSINKNIKYVKKRTCGKPVKINLPLTPSPALAELISHTLGDGHVSSGGRFVYTNKEPKLIAKVQELVNTGFDSNVYSSKITKTIRGHSYMVIYFPSAIGEILEFFGSVKGNKISKEFDILKWIKNDSKDVQASFIRALFDDEGTVSNTRIAINMAKETSKLKSLETFLVSFTNMLKNLGIEPGRIVQCAKCTSKSGVRTTSLLFVISGQNNMKRFNDRIGFLHPLKSKRLSNLLKSYKRHNYRNNEGKRTVLEVLEKKNLLLTTSQIAKQINRHHETALYHLKVLEKEKLVQKTIGKMGHFYWRLL